MKESFARVELLLGAETMRRLEETRVILFGLGGVGSWCAEGLIRSGIGHLTLVDPDVVMPSNINRQVPATTRTVGRPKAEVMRERLLEINPSADIQVMVKAYHDEDYEAFSLESYDYIIDAIDALKDKRLLLVRASRTSAKVFSSMGAALKTDPSKVRVAEFWDVRGCPLGFLLRKKMRREGTLPAKEILCVYDDEVLENKGEIPDTAGDDPKKTLNGTTCPVTAIFGMTLAGLVISDLSKNYSIPVVAQ